MRCGFLALFLLFSLPLLAGNLQAQQTVVDDKPVLVRSIDIQGFVLGDKGRFIKLFRPFRGKHLTTADMDGILSQVQLIYEREGYQELVSISYQVTKHRLVFTVLMKE